MAGDSLRVMSFNIRYDNPRDGANGWANRRETALKTIAEFDADLVGLQEVLPAQAAEVSDRFGADYELLGVPREDGRTRGEIPLILYRRERFEKRRDGTFWLSQTPEVVGSRGWDAVCVRSATWVELRDRRNADRSLLFFNAHWDHKGELARSESAKLMRRRIAELTGGGRAAVVITGDFNADAGSPSHRALLGIDDAEGLRLSDTFADRHLSTGSSSNAFTYHGFSGSGHERIDWILRNDHLRALEAAIDRRQFDGRYASDHFPVTASLAWNAQD